MVEALASFRMEHRDCDDDLCRAIPDRFGNVSSAFVTLLESTTGGVDWDDVYQVVALTGYFNSGLFIGYIIFCNFAFFNIIMSIFVDKVMKLARPTQGDLLKERRLQEQEVSKELRDLIQHLDKDSSGTISLDELKAETRDEETRHKLEMLGIQVREMIVFFKTSCDYRRRTELSIDDFVDACLKMRGPASSMDLQTIGFTLQMLAKNLDAAGEAQEASEVQ